MLRMVELTVAIAGLIVGIMQLRHEVTGEGPSPVRVVQELVVPSPPDRGTVETDIPRDINEFNEQFDQMVEERFPNESTTTPTPPPGFFDDDFLERPSE